MNNQINILPTDKIELTGELVIALFSIVENLPTKLGASVYPEFQRQLLVNYSKKPKVFTLKEKTEENTDNKS